MVQPRVVNGVYGKKISSVQVDVADGEAVVQWFSGAVGAAGAVAAVGAVGA